MHEVERTDPFVFEFGGFLLVAVESGYFESRVVEHRLALDARVELRSVLCHVKGQKISKALAEVVMLAGNCVYYTFSRRTSEYARSTVWVLTRYPVIYD